MHLGRLGRMWEWMLPSRKMETAVPGSGGWIYPTVTSPAADLVDLKAHTHLPRRWCLPHPEFKKRWSAVGLGVGSQSIKRGRDDRGRDVA